MLNYFSDNRDLQFALENIDLKEVMSLLEKDYTMVKKFDFAPENYEDALDSFRRILKMIGEIAGEKIAPRAKDVDEIGSQLINGEVVNHPNTTQNLADLKAAGVMGVMLPREYGGLNFPNTVYTMMTEMISRADASLQNLFGLQDIAETICSYGSEEQRRKYLPAFASGEADGSMDLTEPDSGSDLQSVRLKATQDKDGKWYLDGVKRFITNGGAQTHLVLARSEEGTTDGRGLSMFICSKCPQLKVRRLEHKMGIHGVATAELNFNHVPAELCGRRKFGLIRYVMSLMNGARVAISAQAVGIAEAAYRTAREYAGEREQFKKSIDRFPPIYDMLAKMKASLTAARTLLYETTKHVDLRFCYTQLAENSATATADVKNKAKYYSEVASILTPLSKALSTEMANKVCYDCIQIHGGTGYMHDCEAERYYRDARITNIYEGTTQLQVVAAIGGVMKRTLDPLMKELHDGIQTADELTKKLKDAVCGMWKRQLELVDFVAGKKDPEIHALRARNLVENETFFFVGFLMLRDMQKDSARRALAERYILDSVCDFNRNAEIILGADYSVMERHREVIEY